MYCANCGSVLPDSAKLCTECGTRAVELSDSGSRSGNERVGYSLRINDPAFKGYIKNSNRWSAIFSAILALIAVIGFYIYGETGTEMENPEALYIGFGVGGMFLTIALLQILGRKRSKTWDGVVVDKTVTKKDRRQSTGKIGRAHV